MEQKNVNRIIPLQKYKESMKQCNQTQLDYPDLLHLVLLVLDWEFLISNILLIY